MDFVCLYVGNKKCKFLLDTGATLSIIKSHVIELNKIKSYNDNTYVNGIGGRVQAKCFVYISLRTDNGVEFRHKFYLFNNIPCEADGIIGLDFLRMYNANINLPTNQVALQYQGNNCLIKIHKRFNGSIESESYLNIPARSESIHFININKNIYKDCIVSPKQLSENVFMASSVVTPRRGKIPIKILNTGETEVQIQKLNLVQESDLDYLENYSICLFDESNKSVERVEKLLPEIKLSHLNSEDRKEIQIICAKYADIFFLEGDKLGTSNVVEQSITVKPNTKPVYTKPYRLPESSKSEINNQVQRMLEDDIIEPCNSEWNSPVLLVPKKSDGEKKWRLVVDYRKVNDSIQDDKFPLPNINEILDSLSGSVYFSHLDLHQGFYQCSTKPECRNITSFATSTGQYQMKRLPMGLKISPSAFSRVMSIAMSGLNYEKCFIYCDDLIIFGRNRQIHNKNLADVFERLRKMNLKLNPNKCDFMKTQLLYLGHVVSAEGVLPDPEKVRVLQNYPLPKNADEVRRFVAFCNYYRKFIPSFSEITIPLNKLCRKNEPFTWTNNCQKSFETLKNKLISPPVLQYPDFSKENTFILQTDASNIAVSGILCNNDLRPVAYASRPLNKAELNYPTIQKELLAIVWSIKYFRPYLYGRKFIIRTDHKPLIYLFGMKDPSTRLLKFRLQLEEYDYTVEYTKGRDNTADALSRVTITSEDLKSMNEKIIAMVMTRAQTSKMLKEKEIDVDSTRNPYIPVEPRSGQPRIAEILRKPSDYVELNFIQENKLKKKNITYSKECLAYEESTNTLYINLKYMSYFTRVEFANILSSCCNKINIKELCIIKNEENKEFIEKLLSEIEGREKWSGPRINVLRGIKKVLNEKEKICILHDYHLLPTSGHAGVRRMINNIKGKYFWTRLENDVRQYVSKCAKCQTSKYSRNTKEPMTITTTASRAFQKVFLDIVGPLDKDLDNNVYILSLQCELSKYVEAYPMQRKDTVSVARTFVNNFILRYGIPEVIATDRGSEFMSETMAEVCKLLQIEKLNSTSYHHESIGALENTHKHLAAFLRTQCDEHPETWSQWLPFWCFSFNTTVHTETKYTPYELVFGKMCILPSNLRNNVVDPLYNQDNYALELKYRLQVASKEAYKNLVISKNKRKDSWDKKCNPIQYKKGDLILIKNETGKKLDKVFNGPYIVLSENEPNVTVKIEKKVETVHKNRTKRYVT